jgi:hypothetical protein
MGTRVRVLLAALVFIALGMPSGSAHLAGRIHASAAPAAGQTVFLPSIRDPFTPAGTYDCKEYEYGRIWTTEVITLSLDGASVYAYGPPAAAVVKGTWVYSPEIQEVGFTNFRWLTATVELSDQLLASRYVPQAGFKIALSCTRQASSSL